MDLLADRLGFLRGTQNADGGWGYFPGKKSWVEPTVWAALALARDPHSPPELSRAWGLLRDCQNSDGGWPSAPGVEGSTWVTALVITLGDVLGKKSSQLARAANWLQGLTGAETSTLNRVLRAVKAPAVEREVKDPGWPWRPGDSAWVEPTCHALIALKKVFRRTRDGAVGHRIEAGERMLLATRCADGGWNYGSPQALGVSLPGYVETTALALMGLQGNAPQGAVRRARSLKEGLRSPLAGACLSIALALCGAGENGRALTRRSSPDILLCALEALDPGLLQPGVQLC